MRTKETILIALVALTETAVWTGMSAQSVYPGLFADKMIADNYHRSEVECIPLSDIRLLPGRMRENLERDSVWLMNIGVERLLHSFYNTSGVYGGKEGGYMTVKKLGGWESLDCELRGHTTGHVMSALALMHAATGEECFKQKGDSIVDGLSKVQEANGNGYLSAFPEELINRNIRATSVWAPWYTLHKILSGLIDQYLYSGNEKAFEIAKKMGDWAYGKLNKIDEATRLKMLRNEFGGINEAFYNLYALTGDERYRFVAEFFYHPDVIDPLKREEADFGTKHTNTFIPKVLAEIRKYEITQDEESKKLSEFFWSEMIARHTFAPGCLSDKEHYFAPEKISEHISGYTGETCCTYNMLKLSRHLFCHNPDSRIMDYYERALWNHILGQQDPSTGMVAYFLPLATGTHKVYSTPENSFWCCVGSGFENHAKYAEQIYSKAQDSLYVNLLIPSTVDWKDKGLKITQTTDFPKTGTTLLKISTESTRKMIIKLRHPSWADNVKIKINGRKISGKKDDCGYISLDRRWKDNDIIEVEYPMQLTFEPTPDGSGSGVLLYGPIVLAARLGTEGMQPPAPDSDPTKYNDYYTYDYNIPDNMPHSLDISKLKKTGDLRFETEEGIIFEPLYDIHRERYGIYWKPENKN